MNSRRPVVMLLGPCRDAVSGVSTHLNLLFASMLAEEFRLKHFQVGSEGRSEGPVARLARLALSPAMLAVSLVMNGVAVVHINTSLNQRAFWRDLAYLIVARLCGARVVYQIHGGALPQEFFASRWLAGLLQRVLRMPEVILVLARAELLAYRRFVPEQQIILVPNGIDCAPFALVAGQCIRSSALILAYIGRLDKEKGLYETLQALQQVRAQGLDARLIIAGGGPEEPALKRRAEELQLSACVDFAGPVFGQTKIRLLQRADIFVLTSYAEGLPYAMLESMAAGIPVIVTPVGAIPDVVADSVHGLIVPPRDAAALARAVIRLYNHRDLLARMGAAARRRVAARYSVERLAAELSRVYSSLCREKQLKAYGRY